MQNFIIKILISCVIIILTITGFSSNVYSASDQETISENVYPQTISQTPIYGFKISGRVELLSQKSLVRVILTDNQDREYLVYETYSLISDSNSFAIVDACEETCYLEGVVPKSIKVDTYEASFTITNQEVIKTKERRQANENEIRRINNLNAQIKKKNLKWIAGETSISKLSYDEKKRLFRNIDNTPVDKLPNLQGFEYYKGGIFEVTPDNNSTADFISSSSTKPPPAWDWRNVHGENWNTSIKDQQGIGVCWSFSHMGTIESYINLYFNQHLNIDLSEQMLVDCLDSAILPMGMSNRAYPSCNTSIGYCANYMYCINNIHGIADESCDPYAGRNTVPAHCDNNYICSDWQSRVWKVSEFQEYNFVDKGWYHDCPKYSFISEDEFKKNLIKYGPMNSGYDPWAHAMVLEGYETDSADGRTVWVFKNSWGSAWGDEGYAKIKADAGTIATSANLLGPVTPPANITYQIACVDKDNDTYCNWGISEVKPATCSSFCKAQKDCNDADPNLGPFDNNYNCIANCRPLGNIDCTGSVDAGDLANLISTVSLNNLSADFDNSGLVNILDLSILLGNFGKQ